MRTPLGSALFFLTQILALLASVSVDPKVHRYLQLVVSQLTFIESFVEDLLDLRQMRDGVFSLVEEVFNPKEVIELVFSVFKPQADAKNIRLDFQIVRDLVAPSTEQTAEPSQLLDDLTYDKDASNHPMNGSLKYSTDCINFEMPKVIGDERRFKQVLINLVKNALKFTVFGSISIKACYNNATRSLNVHVIDTGAGIAPSEIFQLFSKFGKLHRTANMNNNGIGLGLTIVKQIVEKSGGKITVYSEGVGKGSTFSFNMKMNTIAQLQKDAEHPPRLVVDESVEALDMEFEGLKGDMASSPSVKAPMYQTTNGISKNTLKNSKESANVMFSFTDEVAAFPVTSFKENAVVKTPNKDFYRDYDDDSNLVGDFSDVKSVRSSSRAIVKHYSDEFDRENMIGGLKVP